MKAFWVYPPSQEGPVACHGDEWSMATKGSAEMFRGLPRGASLDRPSKTGAAGHTAAPVLLLLILSPDLLRADPEQVPAGHGPKPQSDLFMNAS